MRKSMVMGALAVALLFTVNAFAQSVNVDWDHNFHDFSSLKTYKLIKPANGSINQLMDQRVAAAIQDQLAAKGLQPVESGADVEVAYHTGVRREKSATVTGMGGPWRMGGGMGTINQNIANEGTLVVVMAKGGQILWRGVASDTLSDKADKNSKKIDKAVAKMFKKYPPQSK